MPKLEDAVADRIGRKDYQVSEPGPDHEVSFPSNGPIVDEHGNHQQTDSHIFTDVGGMGVWLHHLLHRHANGRVHMPLSHAKDMNLVPADAVTTDAPQEALAPGNQPQDVPTVNLQAASDVTQPGPQTKPGAPSKEPDTKG